MEVQDQLRATVADFFEVDRGQVGPSFPLTGRLGQGSIARAALDSAIRRRVGLKSAAVYSAKTFGELEAALVPAAAGGPPRPAIAPAPAAAPDGPAAPRRIAPPMATGVPLACGVDIELVESLPAAADCWEHEFYATVFTPKEIAYCLLQESPALHFAGRWCAKEALKKCDPDLLAEEMKDLEFVSGEPGGPYFRRYVNGQAHRLPHAVSMSHTAHAAVAVVVKLGGPAPAAAEVAPVPAPAPAPAPAPRGGLGALAVLISLVALGLAALALIRTFRA
jgi:phosphopantetheine--protein transferase-like protein